MPLALAAPAETTLVTDNDFTGADAVNLVIDGGDNASGTLTFASSTGDIISAQYLAQEANACVLLGNAVRTLP